MLYQPNERELAFCVGRDDAFRRAQAILTDINRFTLKPDGNIAVNEDKGRFTIYTNPGKCNCRTFRLNPWLSPRPNGNHVAHCPHTLAWETYKRILREHYQLQRQRMNPPQPADKWLRGEHHPINIAAYFAFAEWLADNSQRSTVMLVKQAELKRKHTELPAGYTAMPWQA